MRFADILASVPANKPVFVTGGSAFPGGLADIFARSPDLADGRTFCGAFIPGMTRSDPSAGAPGAQVRSIFPVPGAARCSLLPFHYSAFYRWLSEPGNVALGLAQVSMPRHGMVSLGLAADFLPAVEASGALLAGQCNPAMPWIEGAPQIPVSRFAFLEEMRTPVAGFASPAADPVSERIGSNILPFVPDGATIELGLGRIQAGVFEAMADAGTKIDLWGGMLSAAALPLFASGRIGNATVGQVLGENPLHEAASDLDNLRVAPVSVTHGFQEISVKRRFRAINSALAVDLSGQATVESTGGRTVSGTGGLMDFVRGAMAAPGGRSIIALPARRQGRPTILARFPAGARVSLPACDADIVVTEYGAAELRGLPVEERAARLIAIAHPGDRDGIARDREAAGGSRNEGFER